MLQGNFTEGDGYAAARISTAEMLLTGTTCFLESMVRMYLREERNFPTFFKTFPRDWTR